MKRLTWTDALQEDLVQMREVALANSLARECTAVMTSFAHHCTASCHSLYGSKASVYFPHSC